MNLSKALADPPVVVPSRAFAWIAGILAVLTSLPTLFTRGLIADDWSGYYVF